ncbi:MAG: hypothetical protein RL227_2868 [Pseudomonadota bacterium]
MRDTSLYSQPLARVRFTDCCDALSTKPDCNASNAIVTADSRTVWRTSFTLSTGAPATDSGELVSFGRDTELPTGRRKYASSPPPIRHRMAGWR